MAMAEKAKDIGQQVKDVGQQAVQKGQQALQQVDRATSVPMRMGEQTPSKVYMGAVIGSILASAGLFLAGRTAAGIFVGLWAPTILNLGLFNKLLQPSQESTTGEYGASGGFGSEAYGAAGTSGTTGGTEAGRAF